ncbi:nitrate reductase molybdenum cofactor assembly chaperone [Pseudonocardia saturnea]
MTLFRPSPAPPTIRQRSLVHRIAALALDYPDVDLVARIPSMRAATDGLDEPFRGLLGRTLDHLGRTPVAQLEADYVATFDLRRRCSPYLTYYAYGDTRKRGIALLVFKQAYRLAGVELTADELPDHLCVVLEFAATADPDAGTRLLIEHRAGLELLRLALADSGSPYADALAAVSATLPPLAGPEREAVARLAAQGPPNEDVGLEPFAPPDYMGART